VRREGGCLCGAVRYVVAGPVREIVVCHCVECRRWAGCAWPATAAELSDFTVAGDVVWRRSPRSEYRARRGNCAQCCAALFWQAEDWSRVAIGAGTLDDPSGLRVAAHIWVEQGADWQRPPDGVPSHPRGYPAGAPPLAWH
jgi:hypothetical protein